MRVVIDITFNSVLVILGWALNCMLCMYHCNNNYVIYKALHIWNILPIKCIYNIYIYIYIYNIF